MTGELVDGSGTTWTTLQGASSIVGDNVGYNNLYSAGFGVDRQTQSVLEGTERAAAFAMGISQAASVTAGLGGMYDPNATLFQQSAPPLIPPQEIRWIRQVEQQQQAGGSMSRRALQNLKRMGLEDVDLYGASFNTGRKRLEGAGFEWKETTDTGRQVFKNPTTGAEVYYDSGDALVGNQGPHWHIRDSAGISYDRNGRPVTASDESGHIPGG